MAFGVPEEEEAARSLKSHSADFRLLPTPSFTQQERDGGRESNAYRLAKVEGRVSPLIKSNIEQVAKHPQPQGEAYSDEQLAQLPVFWDSRYQQRPCSADAEQWR